MNLNDKVIAITGGARGLGYAMALELGRSGAKLALIDITEDALNSAIDNLSKQNIDAKAYVTNVCDEVQVDDTFKKIREDFTQLHGLVNNAGILRDGLLIKAKDGVISQRMSLNEWQSVIDVNLTGVFLCGRAAATAFVEQSMADNNFKQNGGAVIINISSVSKDGNYGQTNYSAAKAGVAAMSATWAKELAKYGVRSASIAPGFMATEMTALMPEKAIEQAVAAIPVGRAGQPEEIAHTVRFIFENDFISGRVFEIDGGTRI